MSVISSSIHGSGQPDPFDPLSVPPSYFGMHLQEPFTQPKVFNYHGLPIAFGAYRIAGRVTWRRVETSQNVYNFTSGVAPAPTASLDAYAYLANYMGVDSIYTLAETPIWAGGVSGQTWPPSDYQYLADFVTAIINRYGLGTTPKIRNWEIMNEPNYFQGTTAQLVQWAQTVYSTIKALNPNLVVLSPCPTRSGTPNLTPAQMMDAYLSGGATGYQDIATFHGYLHTPGSESELVQNISDYLTVLANYGLENLPVWNTEGSWGTVSSFPDTNAQAAYTAKYFLLQWGLGIRRVYWYMADDNVAGLPYPPSPSLGWGTLVTSSGLTSAGLAYQEVRKWMLGAQVGMYSQDGTVWTVPITRPAENYGALAVWDATGSSRSVPSQYTQFRDLAGNVAPAGTTITLSNNPILLETESVF